MSESKSTELSNGTQVVKYYGDSSVDSTVDEHFARALSNHSRSPTPLPSVHSVTVAVPTKNGSSCRGSLSSSPSDNSSPESSPLTHLHSLQQCPVSSASLPASPQVTSLPGRTRRSSLSPIMPCQKGSRRSASIMPIPLLTPLTPSPASNKIVQSPSQKTPSPLKPLTPSSTVTPVSSVPSFAKVSKHLLHPPPLSSCISPNTPLVQHAPSLPVSQPTLSPRMIYTPPPPPAVIEPVPGPSLVPPTSAWYPARGCCSNLPTQSRERVKGSFASYPVLPNHPIHPEVDSFTDLPRVPGENVTNQPLSSLPSTHPSMLADHTSYNSEAWEYTHQQYVPCLELGHTSRPHCQAHPGPLRHVPMRRSYSTPYPSSAHMASQMMMSAGSHDPLWARQFPSRGSLTIEDLDVILEMNSEM